MKSDVLFAKEFCFANNILFFVDLYNKVIPFLLVNGEYYCVYILSDTEREVPWLVAGSPAHDVLVQHLSTPNFQKQVKQAAHGTHTGALESFHSLILAYASKRVDFDPPSYNGRVWLAIMDHNENAGRPLKIGKHNP